MTFTTTQEEHSQVLITVEVPADEMTKYEDEAAKQISEEVEIQGFRKGQAPKYLVISRVGPEAFFQEALNIALPRTYFKAVTESKLEVISKPEVKVITNTPFKYEARVAVLPKVTLEKVDEIKIPAEKIEIKPAEIDEIVSEMRRMQATFKDKEGAIEKGDRVEIDFEGFDEGGALLDNTKSSNHHLFVGEGSLIPGFEENLIGMKLGEKKKFPVTFPKDYNHTPFQNKKVHFDVAVKKVQLPVLPEVDEAFVEKVIGTKKPVTEFRALLEKDVQMRKESETHRKREAKLFERLLKDAKLDVPPILIEEEIDYMIEDLKKEVEQRGGTFEEFSAEMKKKSRDLRKESHPEAEKRVKLRLILNYLFKTLPIQVADSEIAEAQATFLKAVPEDQQAQYKKQFENKEGVYARMQNNLMLEKLLKRFLA